MEIPRFNITLPPNMRSINQIIIHCSATPEGRDVTVDQIRRMHIQDNHWNDIGYHYVIYRDGSIHPGRPIGTAGAHTKNHNAHSIGICYIGGMDSEYKKAKDTRTPQQKEALLQLVKQLFELFGPLQVNGHNEYAAKACPSFSVKDWVKQNPITVGPKPNIPSSEQKKESNWLAKLIELIIKLFSKKTEKPAEAPAEAPHNLPRTRRSPIPVDTIPLEENFEELDAPEEPGWWNENF